MRGTLAAREARLAYLMLAPTFVIVFAIVLFPVIANLWISVKPVELADLRPPQPLVRERVRATPSAPGETFEIRYQMRNSSMDVTVRDVALFDALPAGLTLVSDAPRCETSEGSLACDLGAWEGGYRENLDLVFEAGPAYFDAGAADPLDTTPDMRGRAPNVLTNATFTLSNFERVVSAPDFWPTLRVTLWYTIFGTLGSILLGLFAAQLLDAQFFGKGALRGLFLFPYVAPVIAAAFTWAFLLDPLSGNVNAVLREYGLVEQAINFLSRRNTEIGFFGLQVQWPLALTMVILFEAWRYFPFAFLFILARFQAIPREMYEAADVDGASPLQSFWHITLPQLVGILSTLFLLRFIWTFNKFDDIFLLTGGAAGTKTLTVQVYDQAFALADLGAGAAVAVVLFLILAIFMTLYFRYAPEGE
ncbi:MAG: ABC transporter permease subunit [Deinococcus-Thermus bacterium]|nr:ABC transporter permease subunit [Deinococcota bacterium]